MTERRALLTDREREIVAGDADVRDAYKYQTISRVRRRFGRLGDDLDALEAHGGLAGELREAVCGESAAPADDPESALRRLSNELGEPITVGETVYESGDSHPLDPPETPENPVERGPEAGERTESTPEDVATALDALELDDDRREAVRAMYEHLRAAGTARKSDFTGEVYPEHPAGFGSPGGWWNALGKDALGELPGVKKPPEGRPLWQFDGESQGRDANL